MKRIKQRGLTKKEERLGWITRGHEPQASSAKRQATSAKLRPALMMPQLKSKKKLESMKDKTIKIEVYGGCVTEVTGLPEGYDYEIIDYDHKEAEENES